MATFALVHGAWQRGWHWHAVVDLLRDRGHQVVAPDVPFDQPGVGARECAQVVVDELRAAGLSGGPVTVVGHSYGGLIVPVIASLLPTAQMVFLVGLIPRVGVAAADHISRRATTERFNSSVARRLETRDDGSSRWPSLTDAAETLYDELPRGVALVAASHLRPLYYTVWDEPCPLAAWPDAASFYLVFERDQVLNTDWLREACRSQLDVLPIEMRGGHSAFLAHPGELVDVLVELAAEPAVDQATG